MENLKGKKVVVLGGSVGIGFATAKAAANEGAELIIVSSSQQRLDKALAQLPANTKSFAILMYDVDGQYGAGVSHWVAYNIAPTTTELAEGDGTAGKGFTGGSNTRGLANYMGPCPPQGDGPHHYLITVMATDLEPNLAPGLTREQFLAATKGHLLTSATIGGLFARSYE